MMAAFAVICFVRVRCACCGLLRMLRTLSTVGATLRLGPALLAAATRTFALWP